MDTRVYEGKNDLNTTNPILASQWHPKKNGELSPKKVSAGSHQKVWWFLPYDDPITGKHFDFEWIAEIRERNKNLGCPFLSGKSVWQGYNDLETLRPDLAKEWHPSKNAGLKDKKGRDISTPSRVSANSDQKVWWFLPYDDPITGKHFDFEWEATISHRNNDNSKCPYLTNRKLLRGFNDLETRNPSLASQWHPYKNGDLMPCDVFEFSNKKVWWFIPATDPLNTKKIDLEWEETPNHRSLRGNTTYSGWTQKSRGIKGKKQNLEKTNSLAVQYPDIAKEWHPIKNGDLKPENVTIGSTTKVWWYLPYDDPKTGKHFDFEWENSIRNRVRGNGCPFLAQNPKVWKGFNDLASIYPALAKEWHPTKNGDLLPEEVCCNSGKKIWWYLPYDDPKTGKHFDFEWEATIEHRLKDGRSCPYLTNQKIMQGFNDLLTINPELSKQWNLVRNGKLTPKDVPSDSMRKVWWICSKGHEWQATIHTRNNGIGCPICSSEIKTSSYEYAIYYYVKKLDSGIKHSFRDFGFELDIYIPSKNIAIEYDGFYWHSGKQKKDLKKNKLCCDKGIRLYRFRENRLGKLNDTSYDILVTDKTFEKELANLIAQIYGCKIDINVERDSLKINEMRVFMEKENSLAKVNPKVAKEWHPTKNGNLKPEHVTAGSGKRVWWHLPYDDPITGEHFDFEWQATISSRNQGAGCPFFNSDQIWAGYNDLQTRAPMLASEWNYKKNGDLTPSQVSAKSGKKVWWICSKGHEWQATISNRNDKGSGCPFCYKAHRKNM